VSLSALTSAEISLPAEADAARVSDRIAVLADTVDVVGLTDNHAGQPRMSPLAAVALAREQGVGTIVHVSCRDRNRLALQSQVVGAAALGAEAVLCMQGDPVPGIERVADMTATQLIANAATWGAPHPLAVGAVVNPFADDFDRELRLLRRKIAAGATFVQSQMIFDIARLEAFFSAAEDTLGDVRFYASVALLRSARMVERARALPGVAIPRGAVAQIARGGGIDLARELAAGVAGISRVDALHVFPLGAEAATREVAAEFRVARGLSAQRPARMAATRPSL
jgi:methylenetetrahydrofolate reductase (NADPH)